MHRTFLAVGAALGLLGVGAGAFGAHLLEGRLSAERLATFETGVRYQLVHAVALLAVAVAAGRAGSPGLDAAGWLFTAGTFVFSGTLYALALGAPLWLGAVTPLGGAAFLAGWAALLLVALRRG